MHEAPAGRARDELRPANAQIESLLRKALADAGRLPGGAGSDSVPWAAPRAGPAAV
ncbi:hypothetical protein [Streptomyces sp. HUAS TT20]|uniref:hypothetical protein n=1 Tax=Streptomyces sp. HUAS TT20 TaxID=3447509 RepID=UPI0021D995CF|nr:hypothetical protein [Streptomyces sp. HUAS 15-9]UXY29654.1 hypothetical protein N8I87_25920 [Streptomyces sp. HUAS 15-9]